MSEEEPVKPESPLSSFIEGAGLPGLIILICACVGAAIGAWHWGISASALIKATRYGAMAGLLLVVMGSGELVILTLFEREPWKNKLARAAGLGLVLAGLGYGFSGSFAAA